MLTKYCSIHSPYIGQLILSQLDNFHSFFSLFQEQHFINDTLRSEFHKKFMEKYVK